MNKVVSLMVWACLLCACTHKEEKRGEESIRVVTESVTSSSAQGYTPYVGIVEESQRTLVSFTSMAVLKSVYVHEGQAVRKGQLLATIDDTQARNTLAVAKSALTQASDAHSRMKQLYESQSLPEIKWIEMESKLKQAQGQYDICKKNVDDCAIYAPCDGVIGEQMMQVGETVLPSAPVMSILSINQVQVRVSVPEKEVARITPQTPSRISLDALPDTLFKGGLIEKGVKADVATHTYDIRVRVENSSHLLLPGMVAKVVLQTDSTAPSLSLPVKAIQQAMDKTLFVWILRDGKACRQRVTMGALHGNRAFVTSGLQQGDKVIVEGYQKVMEGTPVHE